MKGRFALELRRRIWVSVSLITLIPIIIFFYFFSGYLISTITTLILGFLIFLGWWIIFEVFRSIIKIANYTKRTFERLGEEAPPLTNEVRSLEALMESLSEKVRKNLEQLKTFSEKTDELNKEVSKKVLILSTILQANDLFSKEIPSETIIQFLIHKLKEILEMNICFCSVKENGADDFKTIACSGAGIEKIAEAVRKETKYLVKIKKRALLDKNNKNSALLSLSEHMGIKNVVVAPIVSRDNFMGLIGAGNDKDEFTFDENYLDVLNLFSQNIALIWEHKKLSAKIEDLEIIDCLTGAYKEKFITVRLNEEIKRSAMYQRPCGFILMELSNHGDFQKKFGLITAEKVLKEIADIFKQTVRPIDFIGRIGQNKMAVILIERNKRQSQQVAKEVKEKVAAKIKDKISLLFAVAESPINGNSAKELISFAQAHINNK